jgi:hypothetical protein
MTRICAIERVDVKDLKTPQPARNVDAAACSKAFEPDSGNRIQFADGLQQRRSSAQAFGLQNSDLWRQRAEMDSQGTFKRNCINKLAHRRVIDFRFA